MDNVEVKVAVPRWIAEHLPEMFRNEADYWHQQSPPRDDIADQWEEAAMSIEAAIEEANK